MTCMILLAVLALALAARPMGFADAVGGATADDVGGGMADGGGTSDTPPPTSNIEADDAESIIESALRDAGKEDDGTGPPQTLAPRPQVPGKPPAAASSGTQAALLPEGMTPQQVLEELEVDLAGVPGQTPQEKAAVQQWAAEQFYKWYADRWTPAAEQLAGRERGAVELNAQQNEWHAQISEWCAQAPYQYACQLAEDPHMLAAFEQFLQGSATSGSQGMATSQRPGLPNIDPASLDDESRAIFDTANWAIQRAEQLERQLAEQNQHFSRQFQETRGELQRREQADRAFREEQAAEAARPALAGAIDTLKKELGFDPRTRREEYGEMMRTASQTLDGLRRQAAAAGQRMPKVDVLKLLKYHARGAGLYDVAARIKQQRSTSTTPPDAGRTAHAAAGSEEEAIIQGALAEHAQNGRRRR